MPVPARSTKLERIEARVRPEQKSEIERASSLRGTSVSEFVVQNAVEAAQRVIHEHEVWTLRGADRAMFVEALMHPPELNARMKAAAQRYKERVRTK